MHAGLPGGTRYREPGIWSLFLLAFNRARVTRVAWAAWVAWPGISIWIACTARVTSATRVAGMFGSAGVASMFGSTRIARFSSTGVARIARIDSSHCLFQGWGTLSEIVAQPPSARPVAAIADKIATDIGWRRFRCFGN